MLNCKIKPSFFFYISYALYLVYYIINSSFFSKYIISYERVVLVICIVNLLFCILLEGKTTYKKFFLLLFCFILSFILVMHNNGLNMLPLFLYIYVARNLRPERLIKFSLVLTSILLCFVIMCAKLGIITDYITTTMEYGVIRTRDYLGFRYPLQPQMLLFNITLCTLYISRNKLNVIKCLLLMAVNYIMYKYTDARLSFYLSLIIICLVFFISKKKEAFTKKKVIYYFFILSYLICFILSLVLTSNYSPSNKIMADLNSQLGGRLQLGKKSLDENGISLFGQEIEFTGAGLDINGKRSTKEYNFVDNMYLNMLAKYGMIFMLSVSVIYTYLLYKLYKKKSNILFWIMVCLAYRGIIDNLEMYLYYNTFWLILGVCFKNNNESEWLT